MRSKKKKEQGKKTEKAGKLAKARAAAAEKAPAREKPAPEPEVNPYDVFQNRKRHKNVLGERVRGERRDVAKSRASSVSDRTRGLLKDALSSQRSSNFKDARIDGQTGTVSRLVRLRQRQSKKTFNLGGGAEDQLMHGGRPLAELGDDELRAGGEGSGEEGEIPDGEIAVGDDAVARSKQAKADAARQKAEQEKQLAALDADYGDIMSALNFRPSKLAQLKAELGKPAAPKAEMDDYDKLLREMAFEKRVAASDRTKSPEEIAREKAEKLAALERERKARAEGIELPRENEDDDGEGKEDGAGEGSEASEAEDSGDDEEGEEDEDEEEESEAGGDEAEDGEAQPEVDEDDKLGEACVHLHKTSEIKEFNIMENEAGEGDLPFQPACPQKGSALKSMLGEKPARSVVKVVKRIRTITASVLDAGNTAKLKAFFTALLEYTLGEVARSDGDISARGMTILYALRPTMLEMATEYPEEAHAFFMSRLEAMSPSTPPRASELCCLKMITLLYPVTDFQHPVTSPASLLAAHWATRIAALGTGIADLLSDALFLWEVLYSFVMPDNKFCPAFFNLGMAILECCLAKASSTIPSCAAVASDVAALLGKVLCGFETAEAEPGGAHASIVAADQLVRPALERLDKGPGAGVEAIQKLRAALDALRERVTLSPLLLFQARPAEIRMLDPIFHEEGDQPRGRGMEMSESKQLQRRLTEERRAAARQLSRDATALQQLQGVKDQKRRMAISGEKARVRKIMGDEKAMLKKLQTESGGGMDTSLQRYSATKEKKRANPRLGGNATDDTRGEKRKAEAEAPAPVPGSKGTEAPGPGRGNRKPGKKKRKQ